MHLHNRFFRRIAAIFMIFMLTFASIPALAEYGFVHADNARVYSDSGLDGRSVGIKRYTLVEVLEVSDGVAKIKSNGYTVYIAASLLTTFDKDDAQKMVFTKNSRVYEYPSTTSRSTAVSKDTEVNVLYAANGCAVIEKNGVLAYAYLNALDEPVEVIYAEFEAVVKSDTLKVYKSASKSSGTLGTLKKGAHVTVTAYTKDWALITVNGVTGCCSASGLEKYVKPAPTAEEIFADTSLSNEEKIYCYLVYIMDLTPAAACGVLSNVKCESGFRPTAWNASGGSYGICQWTGGRYTNLQNWCAGNGYDYTTLEGQCRFLKYELENKYTGVYSNMRGVENTAQGAYDAGYYWCYYFEVPANRGSVSVKRGNIAKDDYFPKYSK